MSKTLRIAMCGAGGWASMCARAIRETPELELVGCYDRVPHARAAFARGAACHAAESADELFAIPHLDAVCVVTPNFTHCDLVAEAAARGLHVFVEKPMANTVQECRRMIEASRKANTVLFVGHNTRREARFRRMKSMLDAGDIGRPVMAEINFTSDAGVAGWLGGWRCEKKHTPAVALSQIGIHAVDVLHHLLGYTENVQAWIRNVAMQDELEDVCQARMEMPGKVSAMFLNAYSVPRIRSVRLMGTGGNLYSDSETLIVKHTSGTYEATMVEVPANDTVLEEFHEFAQCCREGTIPETDGFVGCAAVSVMEAMIASSKQQSCIVPVDI